MECERVEFMVAHDDLRAARANHGGNNFQCLTDRWAPIDSNRRQRSRCVPDVRRHRHSRGNSSGQGAGVVYPRCHGYRR